MSKKRFGWGDPESEAKRLTNLRASIKTRKPRDPEELRLACIKASHARKHEDIVAINRRLGLSRVGKKMPQVTKSGEPSRGSRSPDHWAAKRWAFEHITGTLLKGKNLNELVRQNAHLFRPEDVVWKGPRCRAVHGLRQLTEKRRKTPKSWKGWSACEFP